MAQTNKVGLRSDQLVTLVGALGPLGATLGALLLAWNRLVTWREVSLLVGMYFLTGIGLTVGYHRMLTHHSFRAHPAVRFCLLALGCMTGHTDPIR